MGRKKLINYTIASSNSPFSMASLFAIFLSVDNEIKTIAPLNTIATNKNVRVFSVMYVLIANPILPAILRIAITFPNIFFSKMICMLCVCAIQNHQSINIISIMSCVAAPHASHRF
jgi:hypothetical protein